MALSGWSTSNYMHTSTGVLDAVPVVMSCWYKPSSFAAVANLISFCNSATATDRFELRVTATGTVQAACQSAAGNANATSTTTLSTDVWYHLGAMFLTNAARYVFINGVQDNFNTTSRTPSGINRLAIGVRADSTFPALPALGSMEHVTIWNEEQVESAFNRHYRGKHPLQSEEGIYRYWPLKDAATANLKRHIGADLTLEGTLTTDVLKSPCRPLLDHMRIIVGAI